MSGPAGGGATALAGAAAWSRAHRRWLAAGVAAAVVVALLVAVAVSRGGDRAAAEEQVVSPLAGCEELTAPPADAPRTGPASTGPALPALTLPCFTGGEPFVLTDLRGPAVVNLWGSWCPPCREELPVLQRLADRTSGELHVVGVVTRDTRSAAAALADDLDLRFPALYDRDETLLTELGRIGLPVTLFVDRDGRIKSVYQGAPFDDERLAGLVEQHLQVPAVGGPAAGAAGG